MDPLSEEKLEWVRPKNAYSVGVLYPMGSEFSEVPVEDESVVVGGGTTGDGSQGVVIGSKMGSLSDEEEPIALSNADFQSAISLTIAITDAGANILSASTQTTREGGARLRFLVAISGANLLDSLLASVSRVPSVYDARRLMPGEGANQMKQRV